MKERNHCVRMQTNEGTYFTPVTVHHTGVVSILPSRTQLTGVTPSNTTKQNKTKQNRKKNEKKT